MNHPYCCNSPPIIWESAAGATLRRMEARDIALGSARLRGKRHNFPSTLAFPRKIRISRPVRNPVFWLVAERRAGFS